LIFDYNQEIQTGFGIALQSDGRIIAGGRLITSGGSPMALYSFLDDGQVDNSFANNGVFILEESTPYAEAIGLSIQSDDKIVVGGMNNGNTGSTFLMAARLNADGTLDDSFSGDGVFRLDEFGGLHNDIFWDLLIKPDGKILLAGQGTPNATDFMPRAFLVQISSDGTPDNMFGDNGILLVDVLSNDEVCFDIELQSDGKILMAGFAADVEDGKGFLARIHSPTAAGVLETNQHEVVTVFPNPITDHAQVNMQLINSGSYSLSMLDIQGRELHTFFQNRAMSQGEHQVRFFVPENIPAGQYTIVMKGDHQRWSTTVLLK
jgi:uncharacterized delta-60 repeat protein